MNGLSADVIPLPFLTHKRHWRLPTEISARSRDASSIDNDSPDRITLKERQPTTRKGVLMSPVSAYAPHGVIPAVLLPFDNDLAIDEASFRKHLRDVSATPGISAITVNAHSTEVASCTFDEQRRVLEIARDEVGERVPIVNGIWADGSLEAARIARMAAQGGAPALLGFPPAPFTPGH